MRFRKKPVAIEADQWFPGREIAGVETCDCRAQCDSSTGSGAQCELCGKHFIRTLEGCMVVNPGDWVVTGIKGEKYPCRPDIFEATYEPVASEDGPQVIDLHPELPKQAQDIPPEESMKATGDYSPPAQPGTFYTLPPSALGEAIDKGRWQ